MKIKNKLYVIEWVDSCSNSMKWEKIDLEVYISNPICISVGFILKETKKSILVLPHISDIKSKNADNYTFGGIIIPKVSIVKRTKIKY